MANIPKLRLMLARMEKSASWMDMVQRAIAKLPGRAVPTTPIGKVVYRGFKPAVKDAPYPIVHGSAHPQVASRYTMPIQDWGESNYGKPSADFVNWARNKGEEHRILRTFEVDPQVQKHFVEGGLLSNHQYGIGFRNAAQTAFGLGGRTMPEIQQFLKKTPWYQKSLPAKNMLEHMSYETGVSPTSFTGLSSYNPFTNIIADIPHNIAKDLIKGAAVTKEELPWRDRVEVYTQNPKGKIYGGIWDNDKSFALPGGGIDEGEDPLLAALRELKEETGINAKNPRLLPIAPVDSPWSDAHRAKIKRNFAGSRTHFVLADAMSRRGNKNLDVWNASNRGYYTPAKAIDIMNSNTNYMAPTAAAARLKALQYIQSLAMAAAKEKSAGVTKEELIHAYKANDPAMRILSQSPVTDKDFLYHASGKKFDALDPKYNSKRSYGHEYTEPVVFAGDAPSSAFASNPTAEYQAVKDKMKDSVYHRLIDELTGRKALLGHTPGGYLYKLPASAFTRIDREDNELGKWNKSTEYVSHRPVKPVSVTPMQSTDVDAIPEYEYLGKDFVGEMPAQHYLKHAKNPKVIAAIQAWLANKQEKSA